MLKQKLTALVFPEGILLAAAVALVHWGAAAPAAAQIVRAYPIVVLVAGTLLALRFRRGRLLMALAGLVLADVAMRGLAPFDPRVLHAGPAVVRSVAVLLPATFAILAFLDERGLFTGAGLRRLGLVAIPAALVLGVWVVADAYPERTARVVDFAVLPAHMVAWLPLGQPATVGALLAIAALVVRTLWRADFDSRGFLWAAVASVIAASAMGAGGHTTLYLADAGLVLVVATVESAYAMAYRDELTGLPARRALREMLAQVDGAYTIAMVDVDHFKRFNDDHGHDAGDQVLRLVGTCIGRVGGGGRAFRYGGEEFAVLFRGKNVLESAPYLEKLREAVAESAFMVRGPGRPRRKPKSPRARGGGKRRIVVTISIGAAHSRGTAASADVLKAADKALYRAKEGGRNRVEW
jgi:diguanylate cyclase (GGDEF)-like protein